MPWGCKYIRVFFPNFTLKLEVKKSLFTLPTRLEYFKKLGEMYEYKGEFKKFFYLNNFVFNALCRRV